MNVPANNQLVKRSAMAERLAGTGIWETAMRYGDPASAADHAAEIEGLGYSAVWIPDLGGDLFGALGTLLPRQAQSPWPVES